MESPCIETEAFYMSKCNTPWHIARKPQVQLLPLHMNIQIKMRTWPSFHKDLLPWKQSSEAELQKTAKKRGHLKANLNCHKFDHMSSRRPMQSFKISKPSHITPSCLPTLHDPRMKDDLFVKERRWPVTSIVYWLTMNKRKYFKPAQKLLDLVGILASRWSDLVQLTSFNHRVGFSYGIPSCCLVVKRAAVLLRVSMQGTESKTTTALESCQSYSLLTWKAPVRLLPGLLTSRSWSKSSLCPTWWWFSCLRLFHGCIYWRNQRLMAYFAWTCCLR